MHFLFIILSDVRVLVRHFQTGTSLGNLVQNTIWCIFMVQQGRCPVGLWWREWGRELRVSRWGTGCLSVEDVMTTSFWGVWQKKYLEKGKTVVCCIHGFGKGRLYGSVLRIYGIDGSLLRTVQGMYEGAKVAMHIKSELSEFFDMKVGLKQGCVFWFPLTS